MKAARFLPAVVVLATTCVACGGSTGDNDPPGPTIAASCAARLVWNDADYLGSGVRLPAELGERLAPATRPGCGPGEEEKEDVPVSRIRGVDPSLALGNPADPLFVWIATAARAEDHPPALERILLGPSCASSATFRLEGRWVGEPNVDEPYLVQLDVDETDAAGRPYLGIVIDLTVRASTSGLNRTDLAAREFGRIRLQALVRCIEADRPNLTFLAVGLAEASEPDLPNDGAFLCSPIKELPPCAKAEVGVSYPVDLYTHCGIENAYFDGRFWLADAPPGSNRGNPPPGWGNPFQRGRMRLISPEVAEFRTAEHLLRFEPAPESYRRPGCA
jgi:hypothetical protein